MKRLLGRVVLVIVIVLGVTYVWSRYRGDDCSAGSAVAHAATGDCPSTVEQLAKDTSWARQRIGELATEPVTTGKLYYPGPIAGFQVKTFTSGYRDAAQADQAIADAGVAPPGRHLSVATHSEVKAAAFMRAESVTHAVLVINMPDGVCGAREKVDQPFTCNVVIPGILPKGSTMVVWSPVEVRERRSVEFRGAGR